MFLFIIFIIHSLILCLYLHNECYVIISSERQTDKVHVHLFFCICFFVENYIQWWVRNKPFITHNPISHIFPHSYISLLFQTDVINSHHYYKALGLYLTKYQFYPFQLDLKNPQCYSVFITANEDQQRYTVCIIPTLLEKRIPKRFFTEG